MSYRMLAVSLLVLGACQHHEPSAAGNTAAKTPSPASKPRVPVDTARVAVLPYNAEQQRYRLQNVQPATLSAEEIAQIEAVLLACIDEHNRAQRVELRQMRQAQRDIPWDSAQFLIHLPAYKRQLVPYRNANGEKEVWVNCFCIPASDWRRTIVEVDDGGNCFFNVKINLRRNTWADLMVNGAA